MRNKAFKEFEVILSVRKDHIFLFFLKKLNSIIFTWTDLEYFVSNVVNSKFQKIHRKAPVV